MKGYFLCYASALNGAPCVMVVTPRSDNRKTGDVPQVWYLVHDTDPMTARRTGADEAICGDCPLRDGRCYVRPWRAPRAVWQAYRRGLYAPVSPDTIDDVRALLSGPYRDGAYGDPASLPRRSREWIFPHDGSGAGYTHQWRRPEAAHLKGHVMASVESAADARKARRRGWQTFRILASKDRPGKGETLCLAVSDGRQCRDCRLCSGRYRSVVIPAHGPKANSF